MPIDPEKALGAQAAPVQTAWDVKDVILYHLGLGAGREQPTAPSELRYAYEKDLAVLPTFAVVPGLCAIPDPNTFPGIVFELANLLHAEHEIRLHAPIAPQGSLTSTTRVAEIWDKGRDALVVLAVDSVDDDGTVAFTNRLTMFLRGEGGFGGEKGSAGGSPAPDRTADHTLLTPTAASQALLYRLSGDLNPLHVDPAFAAKAGFDAPILHGLCSYGMVCKALVDDVLDGDIERVASFRARFSGVVTPGEVLTTAVWAEPDRLLFSTGVEGREGPVLSRGALELR